MNFSVEYFRNGEWRATWPPVKAPIEWTEADRLASVRSENSGLTYRVRQGNRTISKWKNGKSVTKEHAE